MYRCIVKVISRKIFDKSFKTEYVNFAFKRVTTITVANNSFSTLLKSCTNNFVENSKTTNSNPFELDEYVNSHDHAKDAITKVNKNEIISVLRYTWRFNDKQIQTLLGGTDKIRDWDNIKEVLKILNERRIYKDNISNNVWLLKNNAKLLQTKFTLFDTLQVKDINDFIPLFRHSIPRLQKLVRNLKNELHLIPSKTNRLYYISCKLQMDPLIVSNYISKRLFILEMPFEMLQENLNYMVEYGISPMSILRDLWAFRYTPKSVKARLERAKDAKKDKIMPWMVRCPERVLQKSLKLSLDEIKILGENATVIDYIAMRLKMDPEKMKVILAKHDQVLAVRVTKIKEILDYLMDEEKFSNYAIAQVPRILCHGLETTKTRINQLKSIGCRPSSLVILCKSRREYEKFVQKWLQSRKNRNQIDEIS